MKYDRIKWQDRTEPTINLSGSVGHGGANKWDDVIFIQAAFALLRKANFDNVSTEYATPEVTGIMDNETASFITEFQIRNRSRLLFQKFVDARIDPAHYQGRTLHYNRPLLTITLLHQTLTDAMVISGLGGISDEYKTNYEPGLLKMSPKMISAFDMALINS